MSVSERNLEALGAADRAGSILAELLNHLRNGRPLEALGLLDELGDALGDLEDVLRREIK